MSKVYQIVTSKKHIINIEAKNQAEAEKKVQEILDDKDTLVKGKITSVAELEAPKPDASAVERDGGYDFTAWGIHVAAKTQGEAKKTIKQAYGVDVDKDIPPPKESLNTEG